MPISPEEKRALNRGIVSDLMYRESGKTISKFIPEVADAIFNVLKDEYLKFPQFKQEWLGIPRVIAYMKKYLQSDWLRGVQYWPYLYSVFNICTLRLNKKKKNTIFVFRSGKIVIYSLKTN